MFILDRTDRIKRTGICSVCSKRAALLRDGTSYHTEDSTDLCEEA